MKSTLYSIITLLFFSNVFLVKGQSCVNLESDLVVSVISQNSLKITTKTLENIEVEAQSESIIKINSSSKKNVNIDVSNITVGNFVLQRLDNKTVILKSTNNYKMEIEPVSNSVILVKNHR